MITPAASTQKVFDFDLNTCTGCSACAIACAIENDLDFGSSWRRVETFNERRLAVLPTFHLSLACNHCEQPPCADACPALAYSKDPRTGAVLLDESRCIGCRYCAWACPYEAPTFHDQRGVMEKCTFCAPRLEQGRVPACASICPTGALEVVDQQDARGRPSAPGFPETDARPGIRFSELHRRRPPVAEETTVAAEMLRRESASTIDLRSEWPLVVFTLLTPMLVGVVAAGVRAPVWLFTLLLLLGAALSALHLGRPKRAWRAVLNLHRSWLSREVVGYALFGATALAWLLFEGGPWRIAALVFGAGTLFAMDRLYEVTGMAGLRWHSARALGTGLLAAALAAGSPLAVGLVGLAKGLALVARRVRWARKGQPQRTGSGATRLVTLAAGLTLAAGGSWVAASLVLLASEVLDRIDFYAELEVTTPRRSMDAALDEALSHPDRARRTFAPQPAQEGVTP